MHDNSRFKLCMHAKFHASRCMGLSIVKKILIGTMCINSHTTSHDHIVFVMTRFFFFYLTNMPEI